MGPRQRPGPRFDGTHAALHARAAGLPAEESKGASLRGAAAPHREHTAITPQTRWLACVAPPQAGLHLRDVAAAASRTWQLLQAAAGQGAMELRASRAAAWPRTLWARYPWPLGAPAASSSATPAATTRAPAGGGPARGAGAALLRSCSSRASRGHASCTRAYLQQQDGGSIHRQHAAPGKRTPQSVLKDVWGLDRFRWGRFAMPAQMQMRSARHRTRTG